MVVILLLDHPLLRHSELLMILKFFFYNSNKRFFKINLSDVNKNTMATQRQTLELIRIKLRIYLHQTRRQSNYETMKQQWEEN